MRDISILIVLPLCIILNVDNITTNYWKIFKCFSTLFFMKKPEKSVKTSGRKSAIMMKTRIFFPKRITYFKSKCNHLIAQIIYVDIKNSRVIGNPTRQKGTGMKDTLYIVIWKKKVFFKLLFRNVYVRRTNGYANHSSCNIVWTGSKDAKWQEI